MTLHIAASFTQRYMLAAASAPHLLSVRPAAPPYPTPFALHPQMGAAMHMHAHALAINLGGEHGVELRPLLWPLPPR